MGSSDVPITKRPALPPELQPPADRDSDSVQLVRFETNDSSEILA